MKLKDEWFKHFRLFLKENNLYKEFIENFRAQKYLPIHYGIRGMPIPNYIDIMRNYFEKTSPHTVFGAMVFTFDSFKWVEGTHKFPIEFTKKWCTVSFKWGLYCIEHGIEICSINRFARLVEYWESQRWMDYSIITNDEIKQFDKVKERDRQERNEKLIKKYDDFDA